MKRLTIAFIIVLALVTPSWAQVNWKTANQVTVAWDAVAQLSNNNPLPGGNTIEYEIYYAPPAKAPLTLAATVITTQTVVTFADEGRYLIGLKSIRYDGTHTKLSESVMVWSDDPTVCQGGVTFGVVYFLAPKNPGGMR